MRNAIEPGQATEEGLSERDCVAGKARGHEHAESAPALTFLETRFPARELSLVIGADRRVRDPVYGIHRWWARRPPALLRGLLIAGNLDGAASVDEFWRSYASGNRPLHGQRVFDPFAGGGSTLVEAARLGANVVGGDIDPLAVQIIRAELVRPEPELLREAATRLLSELTSRFSSLYSGPGDATPLHYFYVPIVKCPRCRQTGPLFRNLVLARDCGRPGAVVRSHGLTCYCPKCFSLHHLKKPDAVRLRCCGTYQRIWSGTFRGHSYSCPVCGNRATHRELRTGRAAQQLVAVEETPAKGRRRLRAPVGSDSHARELAERTLSSQRSILRLPVGDITVGRRDARPLSYGITKYEQLFTHRQLLVFASAWRWLESQRLPEPVQLGLEMALSNALATNNRLCGYAADYGRLSALFSVRGYSLPALSVELNPLHGTAGRGTVAACLARVQRAAESLEVRRHTWSIEKQRALPTRLEVGNQDVDCTVKSEPADVLPGSNVDEDVDVCIFDPPYYDYIAYQDLSAFYRSWSRGEDVPCSPLFPGEGSADESFSAHLSRCLTSIVSRVRRNRPITFTYHSTNPEAWAAVGEAIDTADLRVTALWPVRSDGHMGHHSYAGNSEWDLVVVCRRLAETDALEPRLSVEKWVADLDPLEVSEADQTNMGLALKVVLPRFGCLKRSH